VYVSGVDPESHLDISGAQSIKRGRRYCKMRTMIISSDIRHDSVNNLATL
jgi:hypothetical protein